ncbi:hypothetical protein CDV31_017184 [Fusarium ambrosium]|uniref:Uncharacterized protein n=1 Tax=Fusarium ambrosium TaxID=131363 RepID=A0A428RQ48_9HYPO|nr:hypothetical protein CDV31_017184 [Fusarium ambrosium]
MVLNTASSPDARSLITSKPSAIKALHDNPAIDVDRYIACHGFNTPQRTILQSQSGLGGSDAKPEDVYDTPDTEPPALQSWQECRLLPANQYLIRLPDRVSMSHSSTSTGLAMARRAWLRTQCQRSSCWFGSLSIKLGCGPLAFADEADYSLRSHDRPNGQTVVRRVTLGDKKFELSAFGNDLSALFCYPTVIP